jgi:hypothetical protein
MNLNLTQTPFSRFGTYLSIFQPKGDPGCGAGLYLRTHHAARVGKRDVIRLELLADGPVTNHGHTGHVDAVCGWPAGPVLPHG